MNIIVLAKHAADPESEIRVSQDGKSVDERGLVFDINDWDRYAVEEAIRLKEEHGGEVVVVGVGQTEDTLRKCLAMGADRAIKVPVEPGMDSYQTAMAVKEAISGEKFDLILAGLMSQDYNNALVGVLLAGMLDIPFATAVTSIKVEDGRVRIIRELEGGFGEENVLSLPALLTVQSGINEPRYVSIMGIKRAKSKELKEVSVSVEGGYTEIDRIYTPPVKKAELIEGSPEEVAEKLIQILKDRGLI
ncbi:electron transfer flavoprotein subunit beta/FixA family protein [Geoglobus acetivorans]|uniref:Electron transfer flavoprotein, beta subunit n=1 Tax=Geoglobus acetivorans TaxID=565033 RepID=A0A0A7GII0_GEOAI|nr:Electron transfer flavoprotein, beta subunit [Geoglobus acetivorans]